MAMIRIATRSSTTAIVDNSNFIPNGTRDPSNARMPSAKAMSVAVGMAQPRNAVGSSWLTPQNRIAGTATPPIAHSTGSSICSRLESWPLSVSRLISSATSRKNTAIKPSLIQCSAPLTSPKSPMVKPMGRCRNAS